MDACPYSQVRIALDLIGSSVSDATKLHPHLGNVVCPRDLCCRVSKAFSISIEATNIRVFLFLASATHSVIKKASC